MKYAIYIGLIRQLPSWELLGDKHLLFLMAMVLGVVTCVYLLACFRYRKIWRVERIAGAVILLRKIICLPLTMYLGDWPWFEYLPFHLCDITVIIGAIFLLTHSQKMYELLIFMGIPGAISAIATPVLIHGDSLWFILDYYVEHLSILVAGFYGIMVMKKKPRLHAWWKSLLFIVVLFYLPVGVFNYVVDTNFMYTRFPPYETHPLVFGDWPYYAIGFNLIALMLCFIIHCLFHRKKLWLMWLDYRPAK